MKRIVISALATMVAGVAFAERIELKNGGNACTVETVGARILSYRVGGEEALWNSGPLQTTAKDWAHGGLPLCWPWFGEAPGKSGIHGIAWKREFRVAERKADRLVLALREGDLALEYVIELKDRLFLEIRTTNEGKSVADYCAGFHPYFLVGERDKCVVKGLDNYEFKDDPSYPKPQQGKWKGDCPTDHYIDRIFTVLAKNGAFTLQDNAKCRRLTVTGLGFDEVNVWNPGKEKNCPGVINGDDWRRFVCVEPVTTTMKKLVPGERTIASMYVALDDHKYFTANGNWIGYGRQDDLVGGASLVMNANGRKYYNRFGYADVAAKKPFGYDTVGWIASNTKGIAAATVLSFVEEGRIDLDASVAKYLPEFDTPDHRAITVRHLLSHTSGLPFFHDGLWPIDNKPMGILAKMAAKYPLKYKPGEKFQYSNWGIDVAAAVVEAVTGEPWEKALQKRILDPLEMKDTTFWPNADQLSRLAKGYRYKDGEEPREILCEQLTYPLDSHARFAEAGGGLFSTANDLQKFFVMVANRGLGANGVRVLKEATMREWYKKQTGPKVKESYSFGMWVDEARHTISHEGAWRTVGEANWLDGTSRVLMEQVVHDDWTKTPVRQEWEAVSRKLVELPGIEWIDAATLPIEGRGYPDDQLLSRYTRLPKDLQEKYNYGVQWGQQEPSSCCFRFKTDSDVLRIKCLLRWPPQSSAHNPSTGKSGVDVYQKCFEGKWGYIPPHFPQSQPLDLNLSYEVPVTPGVETLVYLPNYNGVERLAFGVTAGRKLTALPSPSKKPVVVYGTSITQGGCSSRPGTSWPAVCGREMNWEVINLGFSGSGRMEIELAEAISRIDAALYVIDNVSNLHPDIARTNVEPFLRYLHAKRPDTPILVTHNPWVIHGPNVPTTFKEMCAIIGRMKAREPETWKKLYIGGTSEGTHYDRDYTVDGLHMADWGMVNVGKAFAQEFLKAIEAGK